jgi:hypothetical protein
MWCCWIFQSYNSISIRQRSRRSLKLEPRGSSARASDGQRPRKSPVSDNNLCHQASKFRPAPLARSCRQSPHFTLEGAGGVFCCATQSSMRSLRTSIGKAPPSSTSSWKARRSNLSPS